MGSLRKFIRERHLCGHWRRKMGATSCGLSWPGSSRSSLSLAVEMALGTCLRSLSVCVIGKDSLAMIAH